jgi:hypothetical protein
MGTHEILLYCISSCNFHENYFEVTLILLKLFDKQDVNNNIDFLKLKKDNNLLCIDGCFSLLKIILQSSIVLYICITTSHLFSIKCKF